MSSGVKYYSLCCHSATCYFILQNITYIQDGKGFDPHMMKYQQKQQQQADYHQPQYSTNNLTHSQKQALKDFDAYELKNLEIENRKLTVINDDLLKV